MGSYFPIHLFVICANSSQVVKGRLKCTLCVPESDFHSMGLERGISFCPA